MFVFGLILAHYFLKKAPVPPHLLLFARTELTLVVVLSLRLLQFGFFDVRFAVLQPYSLAQEFLPLVTP